MDQVSFAPQNTGLVIVDGHGQALILGNSDLSAVGNFNNSLLSDNLSSVTAASNNVKGSDCIQVSVANGDISNLGGNSFLILNEKPKTDDGLVQLSLEDVSKLGLQLALDCPEPESKDLGAELRNSVFCSESLQSSNLSAQSALADLSSAVNLNYSNLVQLSATPSETPQYALIPNLSSGPIAYTLQLANDSTNVYELAVSPQLSNNSSLNSINLNNLAASISNVSSFSEKVININPVKLKADNLTTTTAVASIGKEVQTVGVYNSPISRTATSLTKNKTQQCTLAGTTMAKVQQQRSIVSQNLEFVKQAQQVTTKTQSLLCSGTQKKIVSDKPCSPAVSTALKKTIGTSTKKSIAAKPYSPVHSEPMSIVSSEPVPPQQLLRLQDSATSNSIVPVTTSAPTVLTPKLEEVNTVALQTDNNLEPVPPKNGTKNKPQLTQSQLKQIAAALQKSRNSQTGITQPSTLYDIETNTRIICRVVYPEEFFADKNLNGVKKVKKIRKAKDPNDKKGSDDDENGSTLPQDLPRTRSGRLSRPPKHMIKDYRTLKEDESLPFQNGDDLPKDEHPKKHLMNQRAGSKRSVASHYRCPTCNKIYLGYSKMANHFANNPDHGNEKTLEALASKPGHVNVLRALSWKNRLKQASSGPDLNLLKEVLSAYKEQDVVEAWSEIFGGKLTVWDLLRLKANCTDDKAEISASDILEGKSKTKRLCDELTGLIHELRTVVRKGLLQPVSFDPLTPNNSTSINLEDEPLCNLLGLPKGTYVPNDSLLEEPLLFNSTSELSTFKRSLHCLDDQREHSDSGSSGVKDESLKRFKLDEEDSISSSQSPLDIKPADEQSLSVSDKDVVVGLERIMSELVANTSGANTGTGTLKTPMKEPQSNFIGVEEAAKKIEQIMRDSSLVETLPQVEDIMSTLGGLPLEDENKSLELMAGLLTPGPMGSGPMDPFSFTPPSQSTSATNVLSSSTEDLISSLDTLDPHPTPLGADLDFTVLSHDFTR